MKKQWRWEAFLGATIIFGVQLGILLLVHLALIIDIFILKVLGGFFGTFLFIAMFAILFRFCTEAIEDLESEGDK